MSDEPTNRKDRGFRPKVQFGEKKAGAKSFIMSPEGVFVHKDGALETLADPVDLFWREVERDPRMWNSAIKGYDWLVKNAEDADREDVRRTLGWLEAALSLRDRVAAVAACRYLAAMPSPLLAGDYGRLLAIFNSRKVGMVWQVTPDLDKRPLPSGPIPVFGKEAGFGLIRAVPELYIKLAMFGPEMEEIVTQLVEEAIRYDVSLPPDLMALVSFPSAKG
ncbi:hypothetical protein CD351_03200 [Erythrobacter sp. KY5]|uniref:hypothetical protein n=1 Tax=Erythrobacter sp. KY5 TaxID=2011159 RepID=UPI000DBEFEA7|nr:hypothetical protein [Erythrobacter sp. KY5]AWW73432.1 hypothetical protein CD351_03200 [Erythrobacter sp. KY5]